MKGEVRQMPAVTFISLVFLSSPAAVTFISLVFRCFQADESLSLLSIAGIFFNFLKTQAKISGKTWRCKQMEIMLSQVLEGITKPVIIQERFELYQLMNLRSAMHRLMNL